MEKSRILNQILLLTQNMLQKADEQSWELLTELEQQRQDLIVSAFPVEDASQNDLVVLEQIIRLNKQLEQKCIDEKSELQQQINTFNDNKKAITAYQQK